MNNNIITTSVLFLLACTSEKTSDSDVQTTDTEDSPTDTADTSVTNDTGSPEDSGDTNDTEDTDDSGNPQSAAQLSIELSSSIAVTASESGAVQIRCPLQLDDELIFLENPSLSITPSDGVNIQNNLATFDDAGSYAITCSGTYNSQDLTASTELLVVGDLLSREAVETVNVFGSVEAALNDIIASNDGSDEDFVAAFVRLVEAPNQLPTAPPDSLRNLPEAWWPDAETLENNGISRNADDDALALQISSLNAAIENYRLNLEQLNPESPSEADLAQFESLNLELEAQINAMFALEPTIHGWNNKTASKAKS